MMQTVTQLYPHRPIAAREGTVGERLAFRVYDLALIVKRRQESNVSLPDRNHILRSNWAKLLLVLFRLQRGDKQEYIRFINTFKQLDTAE